jgi:hypothetical protein
MTALADDAPLIPASSMAASEAQPTPECPNPVASEGRLLADRVHSPTAAYWHSSSRIRIGLTDRFGEGYLTGAGRAASVRSSNLIA